MHSKPSWLTGRNVFGLDRASDGKAAYIGNVQEEGEEVEADADMIEAELTIAGT